ncbi:APC family permease [Nocardia sp. NPDC059239]|uniref:APC family permease n=1 Tax=unclassified Nocardia TaxID=2637762 RepID=UPI00367A8DBD
MPETPHPEAGCPADPHDGNGGSLGHIGLTALAICSMIPAVGMASFPMLLVVNAGWGSWVAALISALAVICVGMAVIVFARRHTASGSLFAYVGEVFGPWARAITGASLLLGYLAMIASILLVIGAYTGSFLVSIGIDGGMGKPTQLAIYVTASAIVGLITYRGLDVSVLIAVALTVVCLPLLLFVTGASAAHTGLALHEQLSLHGTSMSAVVAGIASGSAFLVGFEGSAALASETRDPKRSVPVAVMSVPLVLGTLYLAATVLQTPGILAAQGAILDGVSPPTALARQAGLPEGLGKATDLVVAIATFAALIGFVNYGSRFIVSLASQGLLPRRFAEVNARFRSPGIAIAVTILAGLAGIVILTIGSSGPLPSIYSAVSTLVVYFWVAPYVLVCIGAAVLLRRARTSTFGFLIAMAVGAGTTAWLYVGGIVSPAPQPVAAMSYVALGSTAALALVFYARARRLTSTLPAVVGGEEPGDAQLTAERR